MHDWLTDIANSQFTEHIVYNGSASANAYYNGNIAQTMVQHDAVPVCTNYTYDEVNRLTLAQNADHATLREAFAYDKMGNVLELRRDSIDHLSLTYSGNQLIQVSDAHGNCMHATEYRDLETAMPQEMAYDANGNLQYDLDRRISAIHYNLLNLPELICFMDGRKIVNLYDAAGRKHGTGYYVQDDSLPAYSTWYDGHYERTDYADTLVPSLCRVHHAEGYVSSGREAATPPVIHYYHRDHLGNTCAVWNATADSVVQRTLYYASGMPMAGSTGQPYQPYKYNGKEFVTEYGYDEYDSQARWYYPAVMRTTTIDPLAEKYYATSPYVWCANNPVISVDPLGLAPIYAPDGTFLGTDNSGLQGMALIMEKASFTQGMSNEEAMKYNLGLAGLENQTAIDRYTSHFDGLSSRPDYDGVITDAEARDWWKHGNGQSLFVDQSQLDLTPITTQDFRNNAKITHNYFFDITSDKNIGRVYGTLTLSLKDVETGEVKVGNPNNSYIDTYDFNSGGSIARNIATWIAQKILGKGTPFSIYGWGLNPTVEVKK